MVSHSMTRIGVNEPEKERYMKMEPSKDKCGGVWHAFGGKRGSVGTGLRVVTPAEDIFTIDEDKDCKTNGA